LKQPNIFQYMKNAGYRTAYISDQSFKNKLQNYMTKYDLKHIDYFFQPIKHYTKAILPNIPEENVLNNLKSFLKIEGKHFAFIVKRGAHFHYENTYPKSFSVFKPTLKPNESISFGKRKKMLNSYYNSLRFNVDIFFRYLLKEIDLNQTIIFYTSDHGQSILENGVLATHCTANNPPLSQGIVPIFIIHNKQDNRWNVLKKNIYSHFNIMPTILKITGYDGNITENNFFEVNEKNKINWFYSGDLFGRTICNINRIK